MKKYIYLFTSFLVGICVGVIGMAFFGVQTIEQDPMPIASSPASSYTYKLESNFTGNSSLVVDQQIKRTDAVTGDETVMIPSIRALFPGLGGIEKGWVDALHEFAHPENSNLIVFSVGPGGDNDNGDENGGSLVIYDTSLNLFRPVLNQPPAFRIISPDNRHLVAGVVEQGGEVTALMQYDIIDDKLQYLVTAPLKQSFAKHPAFEFAPPGTDITWIDNQTIEYSLFPMTPQFIENPPTRTAITTATVTLK